MRPFLSAVLTLGALALPAEAGEPGFDQAVRALFGDDPARYRAVVEGFQAAVRAGDAVAAAALVRYPIEVEVDGERRIVRDAAGFAAEFDAIVTPGIAAAIVDEPLSEMMLNWQGVMLGRGEVWVAGVCADAACATTEVRVVAIQPVAEAEPPGVVPVKAFHDWVVGCDNQLGCTALGLQADNGTGGHVVVRLEAGAAAMPEVEMNLLLPEQAAAGPMRVAVTGEKRFGPVDYPATADGSWLTATVPGGDAAAVIRAMRDGEHLELSTGDAGPQVVSLRGATAALLLIDDRQWRIGTVTALARPGDAPAVSVAARPDAPEVAALPMRAIEPPPALPEGVAAGADGSCDGVAPIAVDLGGGATLWGVCEFAAAYNTAYRFRIAGAERAEPAVFDVPGRRDEDQAVLTNPGLDAGGLVAVNLGRGLGDCGEASRWAWTGEGFVLTRLATLDACAGISPDDWPVLWRTE